MLLETPVAQPTTETNAARFAQELYGLEVTAKRLPGEYDDNFHLTGADGAAYVLKVMHPAREHSFVHMQCQALQHLAERAPQLLLPRVRAARNGDVFTPVPGPDGTERLVWLLTFVSGKVLADVRPHSAELLRDLGRFLGELDAALAKFQHPAAQRELKWDLARAGWIREHLHEIQDSSRRALVEKFLGLYEAEVVPAIRQLGHSVIYGDANDHNVLVGPALPLPRKISSVIDFGDLHHSITVAEVAIAAAYAILGKEHPLPSAAAVIAGYHQAYALEEQELRLLYTLIGTRLAVSVTNSAHRKALKPDDPYVTVSEAPAWEALARLAEIHPRFAHYTFRQACGLPPVPKSGTVQRWLAANAKSSATPLDLDLRFSKSINVDLSVGSTFLGADPRSAETAPLAEKIFGEMKKAGVSVAIGRYNEARLIYTSPLFFSRVGEATPLDKRRTIHLGMDFFAGQRSSVYAPIEGIVHALANNAAPQDYGPLLILKHFTGDAVEFFTLYGHLSADSLTHLRVGQKIARGERIGRIGATQENGGWPPHLHFQVILDLLDLGEKFPGVAFASDREIWTSLSPDPNLLLGIPLNPGSAPSRDVPHLLAARKEHLGQNLSVSYRKPLKIVRGWMQYLYDDAGRPYLDVYNNVPLVGHSHPRVVQAVQNQIAVLNTNTRYLHDNVVRYAERLTALLPDPLRVCFFVNSGSEANELALRIARAHTSREDVIVLEHAYHGHTNALIDISPYKFNGPGGSGRKPWVHVAPIADDYRGIYRRDDPEAGAKYARHIGQILENTSVEGSSVAAFIAETLPSVAGQIVFPQGYLAEAYRLVRAAGAVCIADEVQVGFGRLGTHFWGFETQGVVPDIIVLGKPIGNAFPLAAVVTTPELAASFANGMEFFSTFGGNPVACAAGLAVLDVLESEKLQQRAQRVGAYWISALKKLQEKHLLIGDVRGSGLFLGVDLVRNRETREAAANQADYVVNRLRAHGILAGTDGPRHNVLKLRPPLIFSEADADLFIGALDSILKEDASQPS
jgi:4-aminobutyrate aminotransferase-like enzyme/Ser/Thr protein kinase RdoA (MazF antagonist)